MSFKGDAPAGPPQLTPGHQRLVQHGPKALTSVPATLVGWPGAQRDPRPADALTPKSAAAPV